MTILAKLFVSERCAETGAEFISVDTTLSRKKYRCVRTVQLRVIKRGTAGDDVTHHMSQIPVGYRYKSQLTVP